MTEEELDLVLHPLWMSKTFFFKNTCKPGSQIFFWGTTKAVLGWVAWREKERQEMKRHIRTTTGFGCVCWVRSLYIILGGGVRKSKKVRVQRKRFEAKVETDLADGAKAQFHQSRSLPERIWCGRDGAFERKIRPGGFGEDEKGGGGVSKDVSRRYTGYRDGFLLERVGASRGGMRPMRIGKPPYKAVLRSIFAETVCWVGCLFFKKKKTCPGNLPEESPSMHSMPSSPQYVLIEEDTSFSLKASGRGRQATR